MNEKTNKGKMLKKIQLIEEPKSEELLRQELEEALGGWNCGTFEEGWFGDDCKKYNTASCSDGSHAADYCGVYSN